MAKRVVIVGAGLHMKEKLLPALLRLQDASYITIVGLCRQDVTKGGLLGLNKDIDIVIFNDLHTLTYDILIASGPPQLHLEVIRYSIINNKRCFVEKPHLLFNTLDCIKINTNSVIGYNFNFLPFLSYININKIVCGTNGIFMDPSWSWSKSLPIKITNVGALNILDEHDSLSKKYLYVLHSILVHPISIIIKKYGYCDNINVTIVDNEFLFFEIIFTYNQNIITIEYNNNCTGFMMDIHTLGDAVYDCKKYKAATYYDSLFHFVTTDNDSDQINNFTFGSIMMNVLEKIETFFYI